MAYPKIVLLNDNKLLIYTSIYRDSPELVIPLSSNPSIMKQDANEALGGSVIESDSGPYEIKNSGLSLNNIKALNKQEYILALPDNFIKLISSDIISKNTIFGVSKRISNKTIRSSLKNISPENILEENYGYIKTLSGNPTIIAYSNAMRQFCKEYPHLIKSAGVIITPSILAMLTVKDDFMIETDDTFFYRFGLDVLHITGRLQNFPIASDIAKFKITSNNQDQLWHWLKQVQYKDLKKAITHNHNFKNKEISPLNRSTIIFCFVIYGLILASFYLKTLPIKKDIMAYQYAINEIYTQVGIIDSNNQDHYSALLYKNKTLENKLKRNIDPIEILEKSGLAFNNDCFVENFIFDSNILKVQGITKSSITFKKLLSNISKTYNVKYQVNSADMVDNMVKFEISIDLSQIPSEAL